MIARSTAKRNLPLLSIDRFQLSPWLHGFLLRSDIAINRNLRTEPSEKMEFYSPRNCRVSAALRPQFPGDLEQSDL